MKSLVLSWLKKKQTSHNNDVFGHNEMESKKGEYFCYVSDNRITKYHTSVWYALWFKGKLCFVHVFDQYKLNKGEVTRTIFVF